MNTPIYVISYRVVVISEGRPPGVLTQINSVIRRIDLICKLFAPVVSGFIISFVSLIASAWTLAIWNILSVFLQYWLLISVYHGIPALSERNQRRVQRFASTDAETISLIPNENNYSPDSDGLTNHGWMKRSMERISKVPYIRAWKVYLEQDVILAGISLALLYFTVLR